jgi:hypothetical protein
MRNNTIAIAFSLLVPALVGACGSGVKPVGTAPPASYVDGAAGGDADAGSGDATAADTIAGDVETDTSAGALDTGTIEPEDISEAVEDIAVEPEDTFTPPINGTLFAHTKDTLYTLDVAKGAMVSVGKFSFDKKKGLVTDIALDQFRNLWAVTFDDLFSCDADSAKCKWVAGLPEEFNGLTFIPESLVPGSKQEALIGISEDGDWNWIKPDGKGGMTLKKLGKYGGGWLSSGDAFSVVGIGTFATLKKKSGGIDSLASVDPKTGKILKVIGSTGAKGLFGFAWWADVFYGFSNDGKLWEIDVTTGKATVSAAIKVPSGVKWWGAGVSTRANGP